MKSLASLLVLLLGIIIADGQVDTNRIDPGRLLTKHCYESPQRRGGSIPAEAASLAKTTQEFACNGFISNREHHDQFAQANGYAP